MEILMNMVILCNSKANLILQKHKKKTQTEFLTHIFAQNSKTIYLFFY